MFYKVVSSLSLCFRMNECANCFPALPMFSGKGGKNRRRGKNENETEKRELVFKEDGQGM